MRYSTTSEAPVDAAVRVADIDGSAMLSMYSEYSVVLSSRLAPITSTKRGISRNRMHRGYSGPGDGDRSSSEEEIAVRRTQDK